MCYDGSIGVVFGGMLLRTKLLVPSARGFQVVKLLVEAMAGSPKRSALASLKDVDLTSFALQDCEGGCIHAYDERRSIQSCHDHAQVSLERKPRRTGGAFFCFWGSQVAILFGSRGQLRENRCQVSFVAERVGFFASAGSSHHLPIASFTRPQLLQSKRRVCNMVPN